MGPAHLSPKTKQTGEHLSPSRRWDEPPVLLALAAIVLGAVSLELLAIPRPPEDDSVRRGSLGTCRYITPRPSKWPRSCGMVLKARRSEP